MRHIVATIDSTSEQKQFSVGLRPSLLQLEFERLILASDLWTQFHTRLTAGKIKLTQNNVE